MKKQEKLNQFWLNKNIETLREFESESERARHNNRHVIAALKYDIKKLKEVIK